MPFIPAMLGWARDTCFLTTVGAVQVAPIKRALKAPGSKRLKLKCDEPLSNFAFNFNLRRYTTVLNTRALCTLDNLVGRCRLTLSNPR
jgi:hypothetical protein